MNRNPYTRAGIVVGGKYYYDHSNLDMDGNPICLKCPFVENRSIIRSEKACDKWKMKQ